MIVESSHRSAVPGNLFASDNLAIVLKTVFELNRQDVSGFLFIVTSQESFAWLKKALYKFLEQF